MIKGRFKVRGLKLRLWIVPCALLVAVNCGPAACRGEEIGKVSAQIAPGAVEDTSTSNPGYQADLQHIADLCANRDLQGLNLFAETVKNKYAGYSDKSLEYRTLAVLASAIGSTNFSFRLATQQEQAAGDLALYVLRGDSIPLDVSDNMLGILRGKLYRDYHNVNFSKVDWVNERAEYAQLYLGTLARFDTAIGPSFDPSPHYSVDNGVEPPSPDPNVNAQRAEARRAETKRANDYHRLWILYMARKMLVYDMVRGLGWAYSQPPQNIQALQGLLKQNKVDQNIQSQVLAAASAAK